MKFNELAWGAVCFYYRSAGDSKYSRIMREAEFLSRLRMAPAEINAAEFEQKVVTALREGTAGGGRGFILQPSACPYGRTITRRTMANYETMIRLAKKWAG